MRREAGREVSRPARMRLLDRGQLLDLCRCQDLGGIEMAGEMVCRGLGHKPGNVMEILVKLFGIDPGLLRHGEVGLALGIDLLELGEGSDQHSPANELQPLDLFVGKPEILGVRKDKSHPRMIFEDLRQQEVFSGLRSEVIEAYWPFPLNLG